MKPEAIDAFYGGTDGSFGAQPILSPYRRDEELAWGFCERRGPTKCIMCGGTLHWGLLRSQCDRCGEIFVSGMQDSRRILAEAAHRKGVL
jgi:hypothetical protein